MDLRPPPPSPSKIPLRFQHLKSPPQRPKPRSRAPFLLLVLFATLAATGFYYVKIRPDLLPMDWSANLPPQAQQALEWVQERVSSIPAVAKTLPATQRTPAPAKAPAVPAAAPVNQVTLQLKNGGSVTGELVRETPAEVVLRWDYGEASFARAEIIAVEKGKTTPTETDVVLPKRR